MRKFSVQHSAWMFTLALICFVDMHTGGLNMLGSIKISANEILICSRNMFGVMHGEQRYLPREWDVRNNHDAPDSIVKP